MTRAEFMTRLAELLNDVSPSEREEAIQYYIDYFDDAGVENEQGVIASLGTPEAVAKTIKAGLADGGSVGEFTEKGFNSYEAEKNNEVMDPQKSSDYENPYKSTQTYGGQTYSGPTNDGQGYTQKNEVSKTEKKKMSGGMIALIVILYFCISVSDWYYRRSVWCFVGLLVDYLALLLVWSPIALIVVGICLFVYGITFCWRTAW